ncbi:MAG TPA: hypothetical protein VGD37_29675, partial [Kofleriaceae bacterium]
ANQSPCAQRCFHSVSQVSLLEHRAGAEHPDEQRVRRHRESRIPGFPGAPLAPSIRVHPLFGCAGVD